MSKFVRLSNRCASSNRPAARISSLDAEAIETWKSNAADGQYFFQTGNHTVLVRADALGTRPDGHDTLEHELGLDQPVFVRFFAFAR